MTSDTINLKSTEYYINREISHLKFQLRVLEQATDERHPLLERLRFLLIFSNNLDEFFEIRVSGLKQQLAYERTKVGADGLAPQQVLEQISHLCHEAVTQQYFVLNEVLFPQLLKENIRFLRRSEWSEKQSAWVKRFFRTQVLPVITPIGLDPSHPFPRLANKSLNFIVSLEGKDAFGRQSGLAIVPAPKSLPRLIRLPDEISEPGNNFAFLSATIHAHCEDLFPGMTVQGCYQFRLTRNADLVVDEDVIDDLASAVKGELFSRRYGTEVRLEVADNTPDELSNFLLKQFNLNESELYQVNGMVNLSRLMAVTELDMPHLKFPTFNPGLPKSLTSKMNIFDTITKHDVLLNHPFESFIPVIDFVRQAAKDPNVLAIKQTVYRTGSDSEIMSLLVDAARAGKEVTAVIELRARFDEESNIEGAARLQNAGAVVCYGIVGYKTHAKMTLVVRKEGRKLKRYVHLGTGNYHAGNSRSYTDYSLLTAVDSIGADVHQIFHQLTGMGRAAKLKNLFHAPFTLHSKLLGLIEQEKANALEGKPAKIMMKCNALTEKNIIEALYKASQAGVKIDLMIRGICCLRPGIEGVSENIRVRSIIGRFLEHSRIFHFLNDGEPLLFCSSADLMERNLFHRVEACFPILDPKLIKRIQSEGLNTYMSDNEQSWILNKDGEYTLNTPGKATPKLAQQMLLEKLAVQS